MGRDTFHWTRLLQAPSNLALNTSTGLEAPRFGFPQVPRIHSLTRGTNQAAVPPQDRVRSKASREESPVGLAAGRRGWQTHTGHAAAHGEHHERAELEEGVWK